MAKSSKVKKEPGIIEKLGNTFDFLGDGEDGETATSGNPDKGEDTPQEPQEDGPPKIHQGLTKEQVKAAQKRAESPRGLNIADFQKETGVVQLDIDQLLKFKVE